MTLIVSSGHDAELEMQQAELMARRNLSGLSIITSGIYYHPASRT
jgi:hypothetical protein